MNRNIGGLDRVVRVVIGLGILSLFFVFPDSPWRWAALLGVLPILSAVFGSCMLYSMLGVSTAPRSER